MGQNDELKIGVMVRGSGSFQEDKRSLRLDVLADYLPSSSRFVLLQKELNGLEKSFVESDDKWIAPCLDFSETAAVCDLLDVIISVDTSVAHLALAMGKPTLVLLPFRPDWRWGCEADKTVWYPRCLLLRQNQRDDWTNVLNLISTTVTKLTS